MKARALALQRMPEKHQHDCLVRALYEESLKRRLHLGWRQCSGVVKILLEAKGSFHELQAKAVLVQQEPSAVRSA